MKSTNRLSVEPIAIVGMACRLPPEISSLGDFWSFCAQGKNAWAENPEGRFENAAFWNQNADRKGKVNVHISTKGHGIDPLMIRLITKEGIT